MTVDWQATTPFLLRKPYPEESWEAYRLVQIHLKEQLQQAFEDERCWGNCEALGDCRDFEATEIMNMFSKLQSEWASTTIQTLVMMDRSRGAWVEIPELEVREWFRLETPLPDRLLTAA